MKQKREPNELFEHLANIGNKYNSATKRLDDSQLSGVVLNAIPEKYKSVLTGVQI